jgi:hypothetical protein
MFYNSSTTIFKIRSFHRLFKWKQVAVSNTHTHTQSSNNPLFETERGWNSEMWNWKPCSKQLLEERDNAPVFSKWVEWQLRPSSILVIPLVPLQYWKKLEFFFLALRDWNVTSVFEASPKRIPLHSSVGAESTQEPISYEHT